MTKRKRFQIYRSITCLSQRYDKKPLHSGGSWSRATASSHWEESTEVSHLVMMPPLWWVPGQVFRACPSRWISKNRQNMLKRYRLKAREDGQVIWRFVSLCSSYYLHDPNSILSYSIPNSLGGSTGQSHSLPLHFRFSWDIRFWKLQCKFAVIQ